MFYECKGSNPTGLHDSLCDISDTRHDKFIHCQITCGNVAQFMLWKIFTVIVTFMMKHISD